MKSIIEEQRERAARLRDFHRDSPDTKANNGLPALNMPTFLILEHLNNPDQLERVASIKASTVEELAAALRAFVEREVVDAVWVSKGDLVWSIVFSALDDVDWEELALEFGRRLRDRSEVLEMARRHGMLALLESRDDDLPKN